MFTAIFIASNDVVSKRFQVASKRGYCSGSRNVLFFTRMLAITRAVVGRKSKVKDVDVEEESPQAK